MPVEKGLLFGRDPYVPMFPPSSEGSEREKLGKAPVAGAD